MSLPSWRGHITNQKKQLGPVRDGSPQDELAELARSYNQSKNQLGPVRDGSPPRWACRAGEVILSIKKTSLDLSGMGPPPRWACRAGEVILSIKKTSLDLSGMGPPKMSLPSWRGHLVNQENQLGHKKLVHRTGKRVMRPVFWKGNPKIHLPTWKANFGGPSYPEIFKSTFSPGY